MQGATHGGSAGMACGLNPTFPEASAQQELLDLARASGRERVSRAGRSKVGKEPCKPLAAAILSTSRSASDPVRLSVNC